MLGLSLHPSPFAGSSLAGGATGERAKDVRVVFVEIDRQNRRERRFAPPRDRKRQGRAIGAADMDHVVGLAA